MKLTSKVALFAWLSASSSLFVVATQSSKTDLPPNHPASDIISQFGEQFRCPHAKEWLTKGPKQAAIDLGLTEEGFSSNHGGSRYLEDSEEGEVAGSCVYVSPWSGQNACLEMRGSVWTSETMEERCNELQGEVSPGTICTLPSPFAGWCITQNEQGATEGNPFQLSDFMGCAAIKGMCEGTMQGQFEAATECESAADAEVICEIAPGPIGAAHQAAHSSGYRRDCEGTPAEGSPYMWPLKWTADVESQSMPFGSDEVVYHSRSRVYYMLDRNWKRSDTTYSRGVQRTVGQGPCAPDNVVNVEGQALLGCRRDSDLRRTMIHRGSKMFFITWNETTAEDDYDVTNINGCEWLDLSVVGNIRPDWFMDDMGDQTDVQYLGNQHVYYQEEPRLVKQWRKKDFASQYFTMSVLENTGDDGVHWPMILNVPGEGFGDDFLQQYTNQRSLGEDDEDLFLLDQAYEAIGGSCPQRIRDGDGAGPPMLEEPIPSNLEIDENSWFSNVYTFSTVWEPPQPSDVDSSTASDVGVTKEGLATIEACYDSSSSSVELAITFDDVVTDEGVLPWVAVGYREDEECLMIPRSGNDSDMILLTADSGNIPTAHFGPLLKSVRNFDPSAIGEVYAGLVPLENADGFTDVQVSFSETAAVARSAEASVDSLLKLQFKQTVENVPDAMHLMYAVGSSQELGYHSTRMCFDITEFPSCADDSTESELSESAMETEAFSMENETSSAPSLKFCELAICLATLLAGALF